MRFFDFDFLNSSKALSGMTLGVYLIHPIYLEIVSYLLKDDLLGYMSGFFYIPLVSFFVFLVSLFSVFIMSKIKGLKVCI